MYNRRDLRGRRERHAEKERAVKARNHSRVAEALPHSEGTPYKPHCGEVGVCLRVGRMGSIKRGWTGTLQPGPERGPLGQSERSLEWRCSTSHSLPTQSGKGDRAYAGTKGGCKPGRGKGMPGAGLTGPRGGKAPSDRPALKPYRGKPAVRNFRGGGGNVGIIRSPVRATALPDRTDAGEFLGRPAERAPPGPVGVG